MLVTRCKSRVSQNFQILVPKTKDFEFQIFSFLKFPPTVPSLATLVLVLVLGTLSPWPPPPPNCWPWSEPAFGAATATGLRSLCFYTENLPTWPENQSPTYFFFTFDRQHPWKLEFMNRSRLQLIHHCHSLQREHLKFWTAPELMRWKEPSGNSQKIRQIGEINGVALCKSEIFRYLELMFGGQKILGNFNSDNVQIRVTAVLVGDLSKCQKTFPRRMRESWNDLVVGVKCWVFRMWAEC